MKMTLKKAVEIVGAFTDIYIYLDGEYLLYEYDSSYKDFVNKFGDVYVYAIEYQYWNGELICAAIKINTKVIYE